MNSLSPQDSDSKPSGERPEFDLLEAMPPEVKQAVEKLREDSRSVVA